jgi:hypothetical protein
MALWGSRDSFSLTGTVSVSNTGATTTVVGSGTAFTTELEVGDVIIINSVKRKITAIANTTYLTIDPAWDSTDQSGATATGQDAPKFLAASGATVQAIDKVYGVDSTEAVAQTVDPGWVYVNSYTDAHGNSRVKREVLVASSSYTADAEDTVYPDLVITINTQPQNATVATDAAASFTVVASTLPVGGTVNYRWQRAANANVAFSDLTNAGTYSNTTNTTLTIANSSVALSGSIYRVQLSGTGVSGNVVSSNALLTIA